MSKAKVPPKASKEPPSKAHQLDSSNPQLRYIGGSKFDAWNNTIANQATNSIWHGHNPNAERIHERQVAALSLLAGISPNDEFEGMLAAQIVASHNAAMECYRRAMIAEQTLEGRKENLGQQAFSHAHRVAGGIEPPSRQGATEGHGRTRPRSQRRPSHRRQR